MMILMILVKKCNFMQLNVVRNNKYYSEIGKVWMMWKEMYL